VIAQAFYQHRKIRARIRIFLLYNVPFSYFPVGGGAMIRDLSIYSATLALLLATQICDSQEAASAAPLRVAVAGLVHGHVAGFLNQSLHRPDIQLVGIAESDQQVADLVNFLAFMAEPGLPVLAILARLC
jgi:hypothetical protein